MELKEMLAALEPLPAEVWDAYALRSEPLRGRLQGEERARLLEMAHRVGSQLAARVRSGSPGLTPLEILRKMGLRVVFEPVPSDGSYTMFACYTEPDLVTIYDRTAGDGQAALEAAGAGALFGGCSIREILAAHELFHVYEYREALPTGEKVLTLWKVGRFCCRSRVIALGEIAAMTFTRELLALPVSPNLLDVVLLYPQDAGMAAQVFSDILKIAGTCGARDD